MDEGGVQKEFFQLIVSRAVVPREVASSETVLAAGCLSLRKAARGRAGPLPAVLSLILEPRFGARQLQVREAFKPDYGMFTFNDATRLYWFSGNTLPLSEEFELIGLLIGWCPRCWVPCWLSWCCHQGRACVRLVTASSSAADASILAQAWPSITLISWNSVSLWCYTRSSRAIARCVLVP